jgi:hypothetical protein
MNQNSLFAPKYLNVMDPLDEYNNLGRSVNWSNYLRIRNALSHGHAILSSLINDARTLINDINSLIPATVSSAIDTANGVIDPIVARDNRTRILATSPSIPTPSHNGIRTEHGVRESGRRMTILPPSTSTPLTSPTAATAAAAATIGDSGSATSSAVTSPLSAASSPNTLERKASSSFAAATAAAAAAAVAAGSSPRSLTKKEKEKEKAAQAERLKREAVLEQTRLERKRSDDITKAHQCEKQRKLLLSRFGVFFKNTLRRYAHKQRPDVTLKYRSQYKQKQKQAAAAVAAATAAATAAVTAAVAGGVPPNPRASSSSDAATAAAVGPAVAFLAQQAAAQAANSHHPELYPPSLLPDPLGFPGSSPSSPRSNNTRLMMIMAHHQAMAAVAAQAAVAAGHPLPHPQHHHHHGQPASAGAPVTPTKTPTRGQQGTSRSTPSSPAIHLPQGRLAKKDLAALLAREEKVATMLAAGAAAAAAAAAAGAPTVDGSTIATPGIEQALNVDLPHHPAAPAVGSPGGGKRGRKNKDLSIQIGGTSVANATVPPSPSAASMIHPMSAPPVADLNNLNGELVEAVLGRAASAGAIPTGTGLVSPLVSPAIVLEHAGSAFPLPPLSSTVTTEPVDPWGIILFA